MPEFMEGVSDLRIDFPVGQTALEALVESFERPGTPRVVHTITISGHRVAGTYVVVGARRSPDQAFITLAKLEE